jgi:hypothetical protein
MTIFPARVSVALLRSAETPAGMAAVTVKPVWSPIRIAEVSGPEVTLISWALSTCPAKGVLQISEKPFSWFYLCLNSEISGLI